MAAHYNRNGKNRERVRRSPVFVRHFHHRRFPPFMPKPVAGAAKGGQVFRPVGSPTLARHDMMDFKEPSSITTRSLTKVLVAGQDLSSDARRDGRRVSLTGTADRRVAAHSFCFGPAEFAFSRVGLDRHAARSCIFVNMDLHRRPAGEVPPGALFRKVIQYPSGPPDNAGFTCKDGWRGP